MIRAFAILLLSSLAFWACLVVHPLETAVAYVAILLLLAGAARIHERWPVWMLARRMPRALAVTPTCSRKKGVRHGA